MYTYRAHITSVYDGDGSFDAIVDLGFGCKMQRKIRLYGVDTPEMTKEQRAAGTVVRDYVRSLILNQDVVIKTHKDATGKYGRLMADIYFGVAQTDLATLLLVHKFAKEYNGGTKSPWTEQELQWIVDNAPVLSCS